MSLLTRLARRVTRRAPDFVIGGRDHPYLLRWFVIPTMLANGVKRLRLASNVS